MFATAFAFEGSVLLWLPFEPVTAAIVLRPPFEHYDSERYTYRARARLAFASVDTATEKHATVELTENGKRLGPANSSRDDIATRGHGRYSFMQDGMSQVLFFSTSDDSDPNTNGRVYRLFDPKAIDPYLSKSTAASSAGEDRK